ncbi:hypothetical protein NPIL_627781, partial [Nephila pilipes]
AIPVKFESLRHKKKLRRINLQGKFQKRRNEDYETECNGIVTYDTIDVVVDDEPQCFRGIC